MNPFTYLHFLRDLVFSKERFWTSRTDSVYNIDFKSYLQKGAKLVIFDVDDTLAGHLDTLPEKTHIFLKGLKNQGLKIAFLTNCGKKRKSELKNLFEKDEIYIDPSSGKPGPNGFESVLKHCQVDRSEAIMVGDRLSMDMWGSYRVGISYRILVEPFSEKHGANKPFIATRMVRTLEKKMHRH